ncbi:MAG TPA: acyltransferase [Acidobacteriaceae bacterium]
MLGPGLGGRIDGIDLLRGLAILFVLMNHVNMQLRSADVPYTAGLPAQMVSSLVWNGQYGVQIFFAISGFLITATTLRRWGTLGQVRPGTFYLLRFARIAPLFLLLLAVLSVLHLAGIRHFVISSQTGGLRAALVAALTFRINVLEATRGYLPASWDILWSLSVEELFYLLFPLACRALGRFLPAVLVLFVLLGPFARTLLTHANPVWREYSYLGAVDAIALGCLTALPADRLRLSRTTLRLAAGGGAALLVFVLAASRTVPARLLAHSGLDMSLLALGTCLLITVAAQTRWTTPRLLAPLCWLGQRSYEVYLTHMFVVLALFSLYLRVGQPPAAALFAAVLLAAGVLGAAVARLYSDPINRLLRTRFRSATAPPKAGSSRQPA